MAIYILSVMNIKIARIIGLKYIGYAKRKPMLKMVAVNIKTRSKSLVSKILSGRVSLLLLNMVLSLMMGLCYDVWFGFTCSCCYV